MDPDEGEEPDEGLASSRGVIARALERMERDPDGEVDEKLLIDEVAELIPFDAKEARRKEAARLVKRQRRPGSTPATGQLQLPGIDPYPYEPDRLVADDEGKVIEQSRAKPRHLSVEAMRIQRDAELHVRRAGFVALQAALYAEWATEQARAGRSWDEITFGRFIAETDLLAEE